MLKPLHTEICQRALGSYFSPYSLHTIIAANLAQDGLRGQVGHPEFHFDDNAFEASYTYMESQRQIIWNSVSISREFEPAWKAFGRLTHTAQDFYAHSNYIILWVNSFHQKELPPPDKVEALQSKFSSHPELCSGKIYLWDWLAFIPGLHRLALPILPPDSHTHMYLDSPSQGPLFSYALEAACKRTVFEFEQITKRFEASDIRKFTDR
ncbi:hypothetical protein ACFLXI_04485 [Chloroflexota bacterium]